MPAERNNEENERRALRVVGYYTCAAGAAGAIPAPSISSVIIADNAAMISHVSVIMRQDVNWQNILSSLGIAQTLNTAGRHVFVEIARGLGWVGSTAAPPLSPLVMAGLSALGATTAALQTYIIGLIAIRISQNEGNPLPAAEVREIIQTAKRTLARFMRDMGDAPNPSES